MNLSALMTAYNLAKHFGRRTGILEPRLADRALGYLMSGRIVQKAAEYGSTPRWCGCPDSQYRRRICKHSIAVEIERGHDEIMDSIRARP